MYVLRISVVSANDYFIILARNLYTIFEASLIIRDNDAGCVGHIHILVFISTAIHLSRL